MFYNSCFRAGRCKRSQSDEDGIEVELTGRVDTHSHILPGIDDGCVNLMDSLNCVRQFIAAGYAGTICTPHINPEVYPANTPTRIRWLVDELQAALTVHGLNYRLWPGGELTISPGNLELYERGGIPTLGNSRAILMDWWDNFWPDFAEEFLDRLQADGYQPILAHPERMQLPRPELERLVDHLTERGVWLQGNFNSLSGGEGAQAQELGQRWLQEGRYYILASDAHQPKRLEGRFAGLQVAIDLVGADRVEELTAKRTGMLALGK